MSTPLTDSYLADSGNPRDALTIAGMSEPTDNPYLRFIWRSAFQLACAGFDHFAYVTSYDTSTLWMTRGGDSSARVYEPQIAFQIGDDTSFTLEMSLIDGKPWFHWLSAHGKQV